MDLAGISNTGWNVILILGLAVVGAVGVLCLALRNRNIKTKFFEITQKEKENAKKELAMSEGKDQLENQCQVAKQILKELRIKIFTTAEKLFAFADKKDRVIMELITYRIIDRLNYDIKNDLTRNHISMKNMGELEQYSRAKARGYHSMITDRLYIFNDKLPEFDLPRIMGEISPMEIEVFFKDIYFAAKRIAGNAV